MGSTDSSIFPQMPATDQVLHSSHVFYCSTLFMISLSHAPVISTNCHGISTIAAQNDITIVQNHDVHTQAFVRLTSRPIDSGAEGIAPYHVT